jgi:hypothetical protein
MDDKARYVARILDQYRTLPGTLRRILRDDRRTALALHRRGISLHVVHSAFVLAVARRTFRSDAELLEPIRALRYFLPVIQEITEAPPDPTYFRYLESRLRTAGIDPLA